MILQYTIFHDLLMGGRVYRTSKLLSDVDAGEVTGQGTWMFEATDRRERSSHIIKDCWVEDRAGKQPEHDITEKVKNDMGGEKFHEYFVDVRGHHRAVTSGTLDHLSKILETGTFAPGDDFEPRLLAPATDTKKEIYDSAAKDHIANQDNRLRQTPTELPPTNPPHPRFRYQVVYCETGIPLSNVTSFTDVFTSIGRAADGM